MEAFCFAPHLTLFKIALMLDCFDHVAGFIAQTNYGIG